MISTGAAIGDDGLPPSGGGFFLSAHLIDTDINLSYDHLVGRNTKPAGPGEAAGGPLQKGGEGMTTMEVLALLSLIAQVVLIAVTANKNSK